MSREVEIIPTFSVYGEVLTLVIHSDKKLTMNQIADALRDYAEILDEEAEGAH